MDIKEIKKLVKDHDDYSHQKEKLIILINWLNQFEFNALMTFSNGGEQKGLDIDDMSRDFKIKLRNLLYGEKESFLKLINKIEEDLNHKVKED